MIFSFDARAAGSARLSIEPYLGYSQFDFESSGVADRQYGAILGGKGGFEVSRKYYFALDYHLGGPYLLEKNRDNEYLNRMWGAGAAYLGAKYRLWLGYYYDVKLDDVSRGLLYSGTAIKASLGFQFQSKLSVNIEYSVQQYTKVVGDSYDQFSLNVSVLFLSISAPIYLN